MGVEKAQTPEAAIIGAEKGCDWIKLCLDYYKDRSFVNEDGSLNIQTVPAIMIRQIEQVKSIRVLFIILLLYIEFDLFDNSCVDRSRVPEYTLLASIMLDGIVINLN